MRRDETREEVDFGGTSVVAVCNPWMVTTILDRSHGNNSSRNLASSLSLAKPDNATCRWSLGFHYAEWQTPEGAVFVSWSIECLLIIYSYSYQALYLAYEGRL
jgi:hypothetical protein